MAGPTTTAGRAGSCTRRQVHCRSHHDTSWLTCGAPELSVDFVGQDVAQAPGAERSDYCAACQPNEGCNAYRWFSGLCYLKGQRTGNTSIMGGGSARTDKCSALEADVDYVNNDLSSVLRTWRTAVLFADKRVVTAR
ncbi:hypothetical protein H310_03301 [Aphanomyces invadans]|uniref:Apple domain-containing protein n=1 Tax=Aphanomyces invadans TaxID=157072 RepID=A0A024UGK6_9STRA|nr:hypothetical protein H310_03301 [Aphanomyces invadans]ETW05551.1 hypothetical protein H310_03301 [Aphanomyces invadans]|eukprot:XP_008865328.1 hypothetical protein H310_03301 [Aphanomyces invadans]